VGFSLSALLLAGILFAYFQFRYKDRVIPGVFLQNMYIGGKNKSDIEKLFVKKNELISKTTFVFTYEDDTVTVSAKELNIGYDINLMTAQAMSLGKTGKLLTDTYIILASYINGTFLKTSFTVAPDVLQEKLADIQKSIYAEPVDALFTVANNRVIAFKNSSNGQTLDFKKLSESVENVVPEVINSPTPKIIGISIPVKTLFPTITTEKANNLGIVEEIGTGRSQFQHSIPNRVYNISLASSRMNGILIAPGDTFSFNQALGDISRYTGYKEAYVIQNGRTVLGDGGGVCQVSTTLFRAILAAGLPITERRAHAYRVGYYEQDSLPGLDATIYSPSVDLKFKNDTDTHILIQSFMDPTNLTLQFTLYGKKDNRQVTLTTPIVTNQTPPPPPLYQDDPTLPKGVIKQVDFESSGARASFSRTVTKDGNVIISETYTSNYTPWRAVFLRGTKE
ncbi:MAG: VanW family protein, partial [Sulfurimonas sp.]|nr:VanW family protein [Sulfurimonas sp.]